MSNASRQRFRPPWMGRVNDMRRRYAAGNMTAAEFDVYWREVARIGERAFEYVVCHEPHATAEYPLRSDHSSDDEHAQAVDAWLDLGNQAAACPTCTRRANLDEARNPAEYIIAGSP